MINVFLSYAHSSPEHKRAVSDLVKLLRGQGLTVLVDTDVETPQGPEEGWPRWMKRQINDADWVLMFFDDLYRKRFDGDEETGTGLGATWEGVIITHRFYREATRNKKFIPILSDGGNASLIPDELIGYTRYCIPKQADELAVALGRTIGTESLVSKTGTTRTFVPQPKSSVAAAAVTEAPLKPVENFGADSENSQNQKSGWEGRFLSRGSADFFHERFIRAFPGHRKEVVWFEDQENISKRLSRLLEAPLEFSNGSPIWWFRGNEAGPVTTFKPLEGRTLLLDTKELMIQRLAAVQFGSYWNCFVYVEAAAVEPSGVYTFLPEKINETRASLGYCWEELCLFRGRYLKKAFFEDGIAEIDGEFVELGEDAELRERFLSPYNLVLAGHDSSINSKDFTLEFGALMNEILGKPASFDRLVRGVERLPKPETYFEAENLRKLYD